ncbi:MAG: hypothetical protein AAF290_14990 [Pseudomonadota bacterium]
MRRWRDRVIGLLLATALVIVWWGTRVTQETYKPVSMTVAESTVEPSIPLSVGNDAMMFEGSLQPREAGVDRNTSPTTVDRAAYTELLYATCRAMVQQYEAPDMDSSGEDVDSEGAMNGIIGMLEAERTAAAETLAAARTPTQLHGAGLLHPDRRIKWLGEAASSLPNDAVVQMNFATACLRDEAGLCDASDSIERLLKIDADNSEAWVLATLLRYGKEDKDGALRALEIAATASRSSSYWPETAAAVYRSYRASGAADVGVALVDSITLPTQLMPNQLALIQLCRKEAPNDRRWADGCIAYGKLAFANYKTLIGGSGATGVAAAGMQAINESDAAQAMWRSYRELRHNAPSTALIFLVNASFDVDGDEFLRHLEALRQYGEIEAMRSRTEIAADWVRELDIADCAPGDEVPNELREDLLDLKRIVGERSG